MLLKDSITTSRTQVDGARFKSQRTVSLISVGWIISGAGMGDRGRAMSVFVQPGHMLVTLMPSRDKFPIDGFRKADQTKLAGTIRAFAGETDLAGTGGNIDDVPRVSGLHRRQNRLHQTERRQQVDAQAAHELRHRDIQRSLYVDARIIHQQVDPAVLFNCLIYNSPDLRAVGHVGRVDRMLAELRFVRDSIESPGALATALPSSER